MSLKEYFKILGRGSAKDLAIKTAVSQSFISQIASGIRKPSNALAVEIEAITNGMVSRKDLFPNSWKANWPELN